MLLGDIAVGKTSLARRLAFGRFDSDYRATLGVEIYSADVPACDGRGEDLRLSIWDLDGDLSDSLAAHSYIRGAAGALIVADAARPATLARLAPLSRMFREAMVGRPVRHVINKSDLISEAARTALIDEGALSDLEPAPVLTSALSGENVVDAFHTLAGDILDIGA